MRLIPFALAATLTVASAPAFAVATTSTTVVYRFDTDGDGAHELYAMPADGSAAGSRIFASATDVATPELSHDGTRIAYVQEAGGTYALWVRDLDGSAPLQLTSGARDSSPSWSRDGSTIAFARENGGGGRDVYTVPTTGGTPTLVATNADEPAFAPSGRQLAVDRFDAGAHAGLDLVTLASGVRTRIGGTGHGNNPAFSPDGRWVLFELFYPAPSGCMVVVGRAPSVGSAATYPAWVAATTDTHYESPQFSRDGTQVFWTRREFPCDASPGPENVELADWAETLPPGGLRGTDVRRTTWEDERDATVAGGTPATDPAAPAAPLVTGDLTGTSVTLSWSGAGDPTEWVVLRKPHGAPPPASLTDGTVVYDGSERSVTVTGLATGVAVDFYVFALDPFGNVSPATLRSARPADPPTLNPVPQVGVATPSAAFPVTWSGSTAAYDVAVGERTRSASGAWSATPAYTEWLTATGATAATYPGAAGRSYYVRVRGADEFGNRTAFTAPAVAHVPLDDSALVTGSGWTPVTSAGAYGGGYRSAVAPAATASLDVETSGFTLIGERCPTCGHVLVYVDGLPATVVDTYAATAVARSVLWSSGDLGAIAPHRIQLAVAGTPTRPEVRVDGVALVR